MSVITSYSIHYTKLYDAKDPAGPWSEINIIEGADGIDPSLLFDDDGRVYYTGSAHYVDENGNGRHGIWGSEIDLEKSYNFV